MLELTMIYPFTNQLVIKDGVFTQQNVPKLLTDCRKFVGHFKHSPLACQKLEVIQICLHLPIHKLIQDIITRWDYALLMFDRLLEQKPGLTIYESENRLPHSLSAFQWRLMVKVREVLKVFKEATLQISRANSSLSEVLPMAKSLKKAIQSSCESDDTGVRSFKENLVASIDERFAEHMENEKLLLSTAVDPR